MRGWSTWISIIAIFAALAANGTAVDRAADLPSKELKGFYLEQADGTIINLRVVGKHFVIHFLDPEKGEKLTIPYDLAHIEYVPGTGSRKKTNIYRTKNGTSMRSIHFAKRPINYPFWIHLFRDGESVAEFKFTGRIVQDTPSEIESALDFDPSPVVARKDAPPPEDQAEEPMQ